MDKKTVAKPDGVPDYVSKTGWATWWADMIFLDPRTNLCYSMEMDRESGELVVVGLDVPGLSREMTSKYQEWKVTYDKWWYENFEKNVLEPGDGESGKKEDEQERTREEQRSTG